MLCDIHTKNLGAHMMNKVMRLFDKDPFLLLLGVVYVCGLLQVFAWRKVSSICTLITCQTLINEQSLLRTMTSIILNGRTFHLTGTDGTIPIGVAHGSGLDDVGTGPVDLPSVWRILESPTHRFTHRFLFPGSVPKQKQKQKIKTTNRNPRTGS